MMRQKRRLAGLSAVVLLAFAACGDEPSAAVRAAIAEGCALNSDCSSPLVCAFRTCHIECESSRDCAAHGGGLCVQSDKPYKVCQNPQEQLCERNSDCPGNTICGPDGKCRDACATDRDCLTDQKCAAGTCADPPDLINGKLPEKTAPQGGLSCLRPSDCPGDLVCKFNTCTVECVTPKDCEDGLPCVASRCQLPTSGSAGRGGSGGSAGAGGSLSTGTGGSVSTGGSAGSPSGGSGGAGAISGSGGASGSNAGKAGNGGTSAGGSGTAGNGNGGASAGNGSGTAGNGSGTAGQGGAAGEAGQSGGVSGNAGQGGEAGAAGAAGSGGGTPPPPLDLTVLANTAGATYLALDADNVYWMTVQGTAPDTKGTIYTVPKLGGKVVTIVSAAQPVALGQEGAFVYYGKGGKLGTLFAAKGPGSKPEDLTPGIVNLTDFSVEKNTIVFTNEDSVSFLDLGDSTKNHVLVGGASKPYTMTRRGGFVFWADAQADTVIYRSPIDAKTVKIVDALAIAKAPKAKPQGIAADDEQVFWTEPENRLVRTASVNGGGEKTLATTKVAPYEIALDDKRVYWTGTNEVCSMNKDGSEPVTYKSAGKDHRAIAVDDTWVFWVDAATGDVNRIGK